MNERELSENRLTLPQVKEILDSIGVENMDQFQRRTLDYVSKFSKLDSVDSQKLLNALVKDFDLDEAEAVQIINCMPENINELRVFLSAGRKIIESSKLEAIIALLNEKRVLEQ